MNSLIDQIETVKIDSKYDATLDDMKELKGQTNGYIEFAYAAFKFGYVRGVEAASETSVKKALVDSSDHKEFITSCKGLNKDQLQKVIKQLMDLYIGA
jgi:hypothetical protein